MKYSTDGLQYHIGLKEGEEFSVETLLTGL